MAYAIYIGYWYYQNACDLNQIGSGYLTCSNMVAKTLYIYITSKTYIIFFEVASNKCVEVQVTHCKYAHHQNHIWKLLITHSAKTKIKFKPLRVSYN